MVTRIWSRKMKKHRLAWQLNLFEMLFYKRIYSRNSWKKKVKTKTRYNLIPLLCFSMELKLGRYLIIFDGYHRLMYMCIKMSSNVNNLRGWTFGLFCEQVGETEHVFSRIIQPLNTEVKLAPLYAI
jgi:hypothetical protein